MPGKHTPPIVMHYALLTLDSSQDVMIDMYRLKTVFPALKGSKSIYAKIQIWQSKLIDEKPIPTSNSGASIQSYAPVSPISPVSPVTSSSQYLASAPTSAFRHRSQLSIPATINTNASNSSAMSRVSVRTYSTAHTSPVQLEAKGIEAVKFTRPTEPIIVLIIGDKVKGKYFIMAIKSKP